MTDPVPLATVGRFELVRRLGQGAMGSVYLALDTRAGDAVALKLIPLPGADRGGVPADSIGRFAAEAAAARRLSHPDIVALRDAGHVPGFAWLAMDLAPGVPLDRYTRPARLLPEPLVLRIGERLAEVLAHAHAAGVVHRDIKPANVIVDLPAGSLKVTDFGLARLTDAEATRTGLVLGSPDYLAPEQLAGAAASPAGDLYALGVTLFELLTGRRPHQGASMGELLRRVATTPAPALQTLRPGLPPALGALLALLLAGRAAERPPGAAAVARELRALQRALEAVSAPALPPVPGGAKSHG